MFCNERKYSQIHVLRNFLDDMEQDTSKDSVIEDLQRLINSKSCDLREIRESPRTNTFDFGKDTPEIIRNIAHDAFSEAMSMLKDVSSTAKLTMKQGFKTRIDDLIENPENCDNIRLCDECGKLMMSGYVIDGGSEYFCSDECLHKNYTEDDYAMLCCGLCPGNKEDDELFRNSTEEELMDMRAGSDTYYTEWEL